MLRVRSKMPRAGFEPATTRSSAERSPRLSYLGGLRYLFKMGQSVLKFSDWFRDGIQVWLDVSYSDSEFFIIWKRKHRLIINVILPYLEVKS